MRARLGGGGALLLVLVAAGAAGRPAQEPREVELPTRDGESVVASIWGSGQRGVVLAHGAVFDRTSWNPLAEQLADAGLRVVALDLRRDAAGRPRPVEVQRLDVLAGIDALRRDGVARIALLGASLGGQAVADCLTEEEVGPVQRVVLLAPAGAKRPEKLPGHKLLILSQEEPAAARMRALFERVPGPKRIDELPGRAHAQHVFRTAQGPALQELLVGFLSAEDEPND